MPSRKPHRKPHPRAATVPPQVVSGRWLLAAIAIAIPAAAFCAWAVLCLLFWQGSWQLLYHPAFAITRTPATVGLPFDAVGFATTDTGAPQLQGWWIASPGARYTVLYLHGQDGNLSNTVDALAALHAANVNVFAFDYRGYGQSLFARPSEARWRQDAESALQYLTGTRHIDSHSIVLDGSALGANLALTLAASHPELAGVVLESPIDAPVNAIFTDPRAHLVPARLLVSDRYDMESPAAPLRIPSLWLVPSPSQTHDNTSETEQAFQKVPSRKTRIWIAPKSSALNELENSLPRWLGDLNH